MIDQDEVLIKGLKRGKEAAQERFYKEYKPKVFSTCLHILRNVEDAEDAVSLSFYRVFSKIRLFRGDSSLSSWFFRIVHNECFMILRKRKKAQITDYIEDLEPNARILEQRCTHYLGDPFLRKQILKNLAKVHRDYRHVLTLHGFEGLSCAEVQSLTGLTAPAVKSRLHRARGHFRRLMAA